MQSMAATAISAIHGMEQYVRDARIAMIYEGTNGVQRWTTWVASCRPMPGASCAAFSLRCWNFIDANIDDPEIGPTGAVQQGVRRAPARHRLHCRKGHEGPEERAPPPPKYLRLFGLVALGYMWARMAKLAAQKRNEPGADVAFYDAKRATARFYFERLLPQVATLWAPSRRGKGSLMALDEAVF